MGTSKLSFIPWLQRGSSGPEEMDDIEQVRLSRNGALDVAEPSGPEHGGSRCAGPLFCPMGLTAHSPIASFLRV